MHSHTMANGFTVSCTIMITRGLKHINSKYERVIQETYVSQQT